MTKDLYYCCACQSWSVVVEDIKSPLGWEYVYCRSPRCNAVHHSDDVIATSIERSAKLAGIVAAEKAGVQ